MINKRLTFFLMHFFSHDMMHFKRRFGGDSGLLTYKRSRSEDEIFARFVLFGCFKDVVLVIIVYTPSQSSASLVLEQNSKQ